MATGDARPDGSAGLPEQGPPDPGTPLDVDGPLYAFFMTTIRVEVDPGAEEVAEVLVDEGTMRHPTLIVRADGGPVTEPERERVAWITSRSEWPSWDYGSVRSEL
jgi:hypothetical protein